MTRPCRKLVLGAVYVAQRYTLYARLDKDDPDSCIGIEVGQVFTVIDDHFDNWVRIVESKTGRCSYLYEAWWDEIHEMRVV